MIRNRFYWLIVGLSALLAVGACSVRHPNLRSYRRGA
jgi:hypothetical protein